MMCPVCKRDLAPTLSICLTCGAMINDTVREELETKISRTPEAAVSNSAGLLPKPKLAAPPAALPQVKIDKPQVKLETPPKFEAPKPMPAPAKPAAPPAKPIAARFETNDLHA